MQGFFEVRDDLSTADMTQRTNRHDPGTWERIRRKTRELGRVGNRVAEQHIVTGGRRELRRHRVHVEALSCT